jgi:hypothetical protein
MDKGQLSVNSEGKNALGRSAPCRIARKAGYLLGMFFVTFVLTEVAARMITETSADGIQKFRKVVLLPLRPNETQVRHALDKMSQDTFLVRDSDIGWNVRPNKKNDAHQTNSQGIRADPTHVYAENPPEGKVRIATVGDSYVFCSQVNNGETWQHYLEQMRDDLEILNMGLPGGGTDQAFLRWERDGKRFKAQIVILGIWPDNIFRNLTILDYYRTQTSMAFTKPRLVLDAAGAWKFVNSPIMSNDELVATLTHPEDKPLLKYEYWYYRDDAKLAPYRRVRTIQLVESIWRRYQIRQTHQRLYSGAIPDGIDVTVAIAKLFAKRVHDAGSTPLVLLIPDRERLAMHTGEKPFPLIQALRYAGIDVIDMGPTFGSEVMKEGAAKYYVDAVGHNSPFGNQVFARYLERELRPWIEKASVHSARESRSPPGHTQ